MNYFRHWQFDEYQLLKIAYYVKYMRPRYESLERAERQMDKQSNLLSSCLSQKTQFPNYPISHLSHQQEGEHINMDESNMFKENIIKEMF